MKITVEVTEEDIANGVRCEGMDCPVAIAMTKALGKPVWVETFGWACDHLGKNGSFPEAVSFWIRRFDLKSNVEPITFEIDLS